MITGLRPLLGPATCKFPISCCNFAVQELQEKPLLTACLNIIKRLIACNPLR